MTEQILMVIWASWMCVIFFSGLISDSGKYGSTIFGNICGKIRFYSAVIGGPMIFGLSFYLVWMEDKLL